MDPSRLMTLACSITPMSVTSTDEYNDDVLTAGTPVDTTCWIEQTSRGENTSGLETVDETFNLYLPADTSLNADDTITADGNTYEIIGPPWLAFNPRTLTHTHLQATMRRVA